jgi:phosphate transport system substrate-binding protein
MAEIRLKYFVRGALSLCVVAALTACGAPPKANTQSPPVSAPTSPIATTTNAAMDNGKLPAYKRVDKLQGTVELSGSSAVATFARTWSGAFSRIYPNVSVSVLSKNSGAAISDMAANPTVIGMTSRPLTTAEREGYAKQHGRPPLEFKVTIDAVAIYVFKDNPLASISLPQLERIFAATPKNGAAIDRWGQIGLDGLWAERAVNGIGFDAGRGAHEIMREMVLQGGSFNSDISTEPVSTSVVQAVGVDPGAIGYASVYYQTARTKTLPVQTAGGELAAPTEADTSSGKYPLARYMYLHLGAPKGTPNEGIAKEFLRFVLSEEGQIAARTAGAFAISPSLAHTQSAQLGK